MDCVRKSCLWQFAKYAVDPTSLKLSVCETGCRKYYDNDPTPGKYHYQNCTQKCTVTYESKASDDFIGCAMQHDCLKLPPIPGYCPWKKEDIAPGTTLATISGEWWQERGLNPVYDCFPCQHIHSNVLVHDSAWCAKTVSPVTGPVKAPCWNYTYSYDVFKTDNTLKYYEQSWQLPSDTPPGNPIDIFYTYQGTTHNETWYPVAATEKYAIIAFCSYIMSWINVGSIVWVRPGHELTHSERSDIQALYKDKFNISYHTFCNVRHGDTCGAATHMRTSHAKPRPLLTSKEVEELSYRLGLSFQRSEIVL